ncbi:MAG: MATE family efflux transporter [Candidatus Gastranaerophilales bacterium]|nr:MATE family efflux transporter [Candidatus Gastranaerophilales bacterium]
MKIFEKKYISELFHLALPIIMGNLGMTLLGIIDCFVGGRYSTEGLAAISIATSIHATVMMFGIGLTVSISPLLSNFRGAKIGTKKYFFPTVKFALFMAFILMLVTLAYIPLLGYIGYEQQLLKDVQTFTFILAFSVFGIELNVALKEFLQSYEIVFLPNLLMILSSILNLVLNFIFVFGLYGFPSMGVAGIALATTIVRTVIALILLGFCLWKFKFKDFSDFGYYKQIFKIGLPISAAVMIEFLAFNYIAIILGRVSGEYAAAHNIILVVSSTMFMIPMGISNALAVKIGYANGAQNYSELVKYIKNGIGVTMSFMTFAAFILFMFPRQLAAVFTSDENLIGLIVPVMVLVAAFQMTDGLQSALAGIYKGLKKTAFVMIANVIAYLIISISLGTYWGLYKEMYLFGCWAAIGCSSMLLCSILTIVLYFILKRLKFEMEGAEKFQN